MLVEMRIDQWLRDVRDWAPGNPIRDVPGCPPCQTSVFYLSVQWPTGLPHYLVHPLIEGLENDLERVLGSDRLAIDANPIQHMNESSEREFEEWLQAIEDGLRAEVTDQFMKEFLDWRPAILFSFDAYVLPKIETYIDREMQKILEWIEDSTQGNVA